MNLGACPKLGHSPETGMWYRAVRLAHLTTPINTAHTKATPSRFSSGPNAMPPYRRPVTARIQEPVGTAPTQDLGEALFAVVGIEGFRTLSAKLAYHRNLIVFPEKMFKGSRLEFRDVSAHLLQVIAGTVPKTARRGWRP